MTKQQFSKKLSELLSQDGGIKKSIRKESLKLFSSGGADTESYANDFQLVKLILSVALRNESMQYAPLSREGKKAAENLRYF